MDKIYLVIYEEDARDERIIEGFSDYSLANEARWKHSRLFNEALEALLKLGGYYNHCDNLADEEKRNELINTVRVYSDSRVESSDWFRFFIKEIPFTK